MLQITCSGFKTSTFALSAISDAITAPSEIFSRTRLTSSLSVILNFTSLRLRIISETSSFTLLIVPNSCSTPSIFTATIPAP
jgi:hypothetical protein